jgi:1D-myo-inositol 3-kinase
LRFVSLGHVTNDRLERGVAPGGSAMYAGLAAAELGAETRVVTSCGPDFVGRELLAAAGVSLDVVAPADVTTCFENVYRAGKRHQRVLATAAPLSQAVADADVVFACPVVGEVAPSALVAPRGAVLGAGLQGWLRAVDAEGRVSRRVPDDLAFLAPCHVLFASDEDLGDDEARVLPALLPLAELVVVTEGARGGRIYVKGTPSRYAAAPAREVDPTGAGDVFAAAFLLAIAARAAPAEAAVVAARAAAVAVSAEGPSALPALRRFAILPR